MAVAALTTVVVTAILPNRGAMTATEANIPQGAYIAPLDWSGGYVFDGRYFSPDTVTVKVGEAVRWTNKDSSPHTVTAHKTPIGAAEFDSGILEPGKQFSAVFSVVGEYEYHCQIHPFAAGKIIVTS